LTDSIIIIGAGVAGLAAGCYAQMNGYKTKIFELHNLPGGLCTAWGRKGYVFDGCIFYLIGSGPGQPYSRLWGELGALPGRSIYHHEELMRVVGPDGRILIAYSDPDRLEDHLMELSPADRESIRALCQGVRQFTRFDLSLIQEEPRGLMSVLDWARLIWKIRAFAGPAAQWARFSAEEFAARLKDPFLRRALPMVFVWPGIPMLVALSTLAYIHTRNAGFPAGGSLDFVRAIERRYLELGGEIHYSAPVEKILVEEDQAVGVRLYNDEIHRAGRVISAADGRATLFDMLGEKIAGPRMTRIYDGRIPTYSMFQVSLGVNRDLSHDPHWVTYLYDQPLLIAGEERYELGVKHYCFDPSLAPPGKSAVVVTMRTTYPYWQHIYGHRLYDSEQTQVSDIVIDHLEKIYPGLRGDIEVVDEATPLSYERYTGNWKGSACGWLLTKRTMLMMVLGMRKTVPGLKSFYMAGQWVEPGGGLPLVAASGRNAVQMICREDGKRFVTEVG
jgi:phytoene dehydrogenase-like protein